MSSVENKNEHTHSIVFFRNSWSNKIHGRAVFFRIHSVRYSTSTKCTKKQRRCTYFYAEPKILRVTKLSSESGRSCFMRRHAQTGATPQQDKTCPGTKMKLRPLRGGARDVVDNVSCMSVLIMLICLNSSTFLPMNKNVIHNFQVPKNNFLFFCSE